MALAGPVSVFCDRKTVSLDEREEEEEDSKPDKQLPFQCDSTYNFIRFVDRLVALCMYLGPVSWRPTTVK